MRSIPALAALLVLALPTVAPPFMAPPFMAPPFMAPPFMAPPFMAPPSVLDAAAAVAAMRAAGCPYATWADEGRQFLEFDRVRGTAVEAVGDLAHATRIAVLVPGVDTGLPDFDRGLGGVVRRAPAWQARTLAARAHAIDPGARVAVVAWLGYRTPSGMGLAAVGEDRARDGATALVAFVDALTGRYPGAHVTLIGHSYGAIVVGLAASRLPQVRDLVTLGAPGMGVDRAAGLGGARVYAALAGTDWIHRVPQLRLFGLGHGRRPSAPGFGAIPLPTAGVAGHDGYLVPGSATLTAVADVILSHPYRPTQPPPQAAAAAAAAGRLIMGLGGRFVPFSRPQPMINDVGRRTGPERAGGRADGRAGGRDPGVDVVRAFAVAGVVGGHWLVTGLVVGPDGVLRPQSPLTAMPGLAPVTWVLQTLGLFFFAGGFAAAVSAGRSGDRRASRAGVRSGHPRTGSALRTGRRSSAGAALRAGRRLIKAGGRLLVRALLIKAGRIVPGRLVRPLAALVAVWVVALPVAAAAGVPAGTLGTVALLVVSPLWFLLPYLVLRAVTGPLIRAVDRAGPVIVPAAGVAVVAASDLRLVPGWVAVPAAWSVPWALGVAMARGRLGGRRAGPAGGRRAGATLVAAGVLAGAVLVLVAGYPASAVGVPGAARSNLNPPSLFAVALAVAQIGVFLLIRERLAGTRPGRLVAGLNRAALPIYLGHQSVLIAVTGVVALVAPRAPGLLTAPDGPGWVLARLAWLPLFAAVLVTVVRGRTIRSGGRCRGVPVKNP